MIRWICWLMFCS